MSFRKVLWPLVVLAWVVIAFLWGMNSTHDAYVKDCFDSGGSYATWSKDHWECNR